MEIQNSISPSPGVYTTAPNSPNCCSRINSMECYYSAPASPRRRALVLASDDHLGSSFDEFEFETSKRYSGHLQSEASESPVRDRHRERGDSLPAMAFADELFFNGLVMPLKPPPRLHSSPLSSPKSPRTVCRIPFARKSSWNDDFDPFMVALEKVREEQRGRNSLHRRYRSYSPFRMRAISSKSSSVTDDGHSRDMSNGDSPMEPIPTSYSGHLESKGSAYARWVRDQTRHGLSPQKPRGSLFRQRVRPAKSEQDVSTPPAADTKMAIVKTVQHKPSIAFCLGYGVGSPIKAK